MYTIIANYVGKQLHINESTKYVGGKPLDLSQGICLGDLDKCKILCRRQALHNKLIEVWMQVGIHPDYKLSLILFSNMMIM